MPVFVTASGYVENREVRSRVGTADFAAQHLYLLNLKEHRIAEIDLSKLPTVKGNPLRDQLGDEYPESEDVNKIRELFFVNLQWSDDGSKVAFQAISRDNKDRWVLTLNTEGLIYSAQEESEDGKI